MIIFDTKTTLPAATRSGTPSYTSSNLNSWKGLTNDSWSSISNASSLTGYVGSYIYFEVLVSDTNQLARYIFKLNSVSGSTIYCVNVGWGYEGSTEWNWSIGKIPSEYGNYKPIENIVYNGTSLTSLVFNGTQVWNKPQWHTVWSGSVGASVTSTSYSNYSFNVSGLTIGRQTRISGQYSIGQVYTFSGVTTYDGTYCKFKDLRINSATNITLSALKVGSMNPYLTITKIEQYY